MPEENLHDDIRLYMGSPRHAENVAVWEEFVEKDHGRINVHEARV